MVSTIADELKCPITGKLMVDPVLADDDEVYERAAIEEHLETDEKSPVDHKTIIDKTTLRFHKKTAEMIERLVAKGSLPDDEKKEWQARKKDVELGRLQVMHDDGRVFDAAKLGYPPAMVEMAYR